MKIHLKTKKGKCACGCDRKQPLLMYPERQFRKLVEKQDPRICKLCIERLNND